MNFAIPPDYSVKIKESEKINEYLDLARELKMLWNMRVTVIPMVVGALGTVAKSLEKELRNWKSEKELRYPDHKIVRLE